MDKTWATCVIVRLIALIGVVTAQAQTSHPSSTPVTFSVGKSQIQLVGHLYRPDGPGPFPAVVLLHGCAGIQPHHHWWAQKLQRWGYVSLVVDSLSPRNVGETCTDLYRVSTAARTFDAYAALRYLQNQPFVVPTRVSLMGWSHGGSTVLKAIKKVGPQMALDLSQGAFRASVAFYPWCGHLEALSTPLLILIGEKDDWTPAELCIMMTESVSGEGAAVTLKVYAEAYHSFDRLQPGSITYLGHHIERHPGAVAQAEMEVKRFLASHLTTQHQKK